MRSKARNGLKNLIIFSTNVLEKLEKKENCEANSLLTERVELQKKVKAVIIDDDIKKQIEHRIAQIEEEIEKEVTEESVQKIVDALKELGGDKQSLGG